MKKRKSVQEYELIKNGTTKPKILLGYIVEHEQNNERGFTLHYCDDGCLIPNIKGLDHCPKGHSGYHKRFFPLFAKLNSDPIAQSDINDLKYLKEGLVRVASNVKKGSALEYEIRRVENENEGNLNAKGLLNWSPIYLPISEKYLIKRDNQIEDLPIVLE